jgi:F-type H+-transporting ATPase subunit b
MKRRKLVIPNLLVLAFLFVLGFALPVLASEGGHGSYWKDYLFQIVNFAILLAILIKFIRPPLKGYLEKRHNQVKEELERAKELSEAAEKAYQEAQKRLENLDKEITAIREQMQKEVEQEKKKLMEEAEKKAELMRAQAEQALNEEINQIKKRLKEEISIEALEMAEKLIQKTMTSEDQKRLVNLYIQRLGSKN